MLWFWLVAASMALMAVINLVDRFAVSRLFKNSSAFAFYAGIVNLVFSTALLIFFPFKGSTAEFALLFAAGFAYAANIFFWYKALSQGEATRLVPLYNVFPLITLALATVFLGERLTQIKIAGVVIAVTGAVLVSLKEARMLRWEKGAAAMLAAAFLWSALEVIQKNFLTRVSVLNFLSVTGLGAFVGLSAVLLSRKTRCEIAETLRKPRKLVFPLANETGYYVAVALLAAAISLSMVSVVSATETIKLALFFVLALAANKFLPKHFKEELGGKILAVKIIGTALIALGVYLAAF